MLGLNFVQDEGQVLGQCTQGNVTKSSKDSWLELSQLAQVSSTTSLSNSKVRL